MELFTLGIDLGKTTFHVVGMNQGGEVGPEDVGKAACEKSLTGIKRGGCSKRVREKGQAGGPAMQPRARTDCGRRPCGAYTEAPVSEARSREARRLSSRDAFLVSSAHRVVCFAEAATPPMFVVITYLLSRFAHALSDFVRRNRLFFYCRSDAVGDVIDRPNDRSDLHEGRGGLPGTALNSLDGLADFFGGTSRLLGEFLHLDGNNGEPFRPRRREPPRWSRSTRANSFAGRLN